MVAAELAEPLVECLCEHIVVMVGGSRYPPQVGFDLDGSAHPAEPEVAQPQIGLGQTGMATSVVGEVTGLAGHARTGPGSCLAKPEGGRDNKTFTSQGSRRRWRLAETLVVEGTLSVARR